MAVTYLLFTVAFPLAAVSTFRLAFVGDPVNFTVPGRCADGSNVKLMREEETVATLDGGAWKAHGRFAQRIHGSSASSFILTDANVNDGGLFEFLCGAAVMGHPDSLKVVPLFPVRVTEGDTAVLPGYTRTVRKRVTNATWSTNGTVVCSLSPTGGTFTCGPGYNHSASVAPGGTDTGDFSLTLPAVEREQGGNYTVCVEFKEEDTECAAVSLQVSMPKQESGAGKPDTGAGKPDTGCVVAAAVGWIGFFLVGLLCLALWRRCRRSAGPGAAAERPAEDDVESPFVPTAVPRDAPRPGLSSG